MVWHAWAWVKVVGLFLPKKHTDDTYHSSGRETGFIPRNSDLGMYHDSPSFNPHQETSHLSLIGIPRLKDCYPLVITHGVLENPPFLDGFPSETSIYLGFPSQPCG